MNPKKLREILKRERPDLMSVEPVAEVAHLGEDVSSGVDEHEVSSATWRTHLPQEVPASMKKNVDAKSGLSADEIRETFAPRKLGGRKYAREDARRVDPAAAVGIVRVMKRGVSADNFPADAEPTGPASKDLIIDEEEGILGSQG